MKYTLLTVIKSLFIFLVLVGFVSCQNTSKKSKEEDKTSIMVFSAASLTDVLAELVDSFEVKYKVEVQTNMASSGTLARQIEQGGTPDIYISASKKWANYVDSLGFIKPGFKSQIVKNELVLIAPNESELAVSSINKDLDFIGLIGEERLSIGDPSHVPAGRYAKQALDYFGWYSQLQGKTLPAKDVRSALMVVEMGESPLGIVYKTDALKSSKVKIINIFPEESHKPIVYVSGVCSEKPEAKDFFKYLNSKETIAIWAKYGFKK